jgi:hypothetical protein
MQRCGALVVEQFCDKLFTYREDGENRAKAAATGTWPFVYIRYFARGGLGLGHSHGGT